MVAVPVGAAEQSAGPIMPPTVEMKKAAGEVLSLETAPASGRSDVASSMGTELGAGSERSMSFRDDEEGKGLL
jgi:hypothetical protein